MIHIFKLKAFNRWAKQEHIADKTLIKAVLEIERGLHNGNLGSGLIKKRIARPSFGKRSAYRTLLGYQKNKRAIFFFGYAKRDMDNIEINQKIDLKKMSQIFLQLSNEKIKQLIKNEDLIEVK